MKTIVLIGGPADGRRIHVDDDYERMSFQLYCTADMLPLKVLSEAQEQLLIQQPTAQPEVYNAFTINERALTRYAFEDSVTIWAHSSLTRCDAIRQLLNCYPREETPDERRQG